MKSHTSKLYKKQFRNAFLTNQKPPPTPPGRCGTQLLHSRLIGRQRTCRPLDEAAEHPCCFVIKILLVVLTRNPVRLSSRPPGCGSETRDRACNTDGPFIRIYWATFLIHHQDEWKRKMKSNVCRKRNYAYRIIIMPTVIILFLIKPLGFTTFHNC